MTTANDTQVARTSFDNGNSQKTAQGFHTTPHDTVLAQLQPTPKPQTLNRSEGKFPFNEEVPSHNVQGFSGQDSNASQSKVDVGRSPAPSTYTGVTANLRHAGNQNNVQVQPQTADLLLDPFDGSSHGVLLPHDIHILPQGEEEEPPQRLVTDVSGSTGEAMWTHLSRVLELQSQIARMHIEMEGIGTGDGHMKGKPGTLGKGSAAMDEKRAFHGHSRFRSRALSNVSTVESVYDKGADEEGVGVGDEEVDQYKAREEEFAKLADQFEGKKESIRGIMNKLDDLSKALSEFHALQAPMIEIGSSRRSSLGVTQRNPPASLPPPGVPELAMPLAHASLPPFPTLWTPPKTPFFSTTPKILPHSFTRNEFPPRNPAQDASLPTVLINSKELGDSHSHEVMESPESTLGSLHPE